MDREQWLRLALRRVGSVAARDAFCKVMPCAWMNVALPSMRDSGR